MADRTLNVWLGGQQVAVLHQGRADLTLEYLGSEVARSGTGSVVLSASLLVRRRPYVGNSVVYWLEGLLPEGEARTTLEAMHNVRRGDTFGLLAAIGRECAGAISFHPEGAAPSGPGTPRPITQDELAQAIVDLPAHPLGASEETGISLGGLQSKLLVCRVDDGWGLPTDGAPSTHIMKPEPAEHPGLAAGEEYSMRLGRAAGIDTAGADLLMIAGRRVLVVERFDREYVDGAIQRLHQEDACQALGLDSRDRKKYQEATGGPSYGQMAALLRAHAIDVSSELKKLAKAMILTVAVGNTDAHGKNHGFLIKNGSLSFSPVYDMAPTVQFVTRRTLALFVGGENRLWRVTKMHLELEARSWGLSGREAVDAVEETTSKIVYALDDMSEGEAAREVIGSIRECALRLAASNSLSTS